MTILTAPSDLLSLSTRATAMVFADEKSQELQLQLQKIAPSHANVLIIGDTGTGKELVARHIHNISQVRDGPFVAVNCGALSHSLIESELFGHEKGAFTGAFSAKAGWFEAADGGTLFLDEIGDLPLAMQVKLLRVLQEREVIRVGSRRPIPVQVRLIAATNVNLEAAVAAGTFRQDLYYRLNVSIVRLLPLRERPGDILPLARHFLKQYGERLGQVQSRFTDRAVDTLLAHPWPGNIRELENVVHHALLVASADAVDAADLRLHAFPESEVVDRQPEVERALETALLNMFDHYGSELFARVERTLMQVAFNYCKQNQLETGRLLGVSRNVVRARLLHHNIISSRKFTPTPREAAPAAPGIASTLKPGELRVGFQKFGTSIILKVRGSLEARLRRLGVKVQWTEFTSGLPMLEALNAGWLDFATTGETPPVFAQAAKDSQLVYLGYEQASPRAEAIVVHKNSTIQSITELWGRKVAVARGSNAHYLLLKALMQAGVQNNDVDVRYLAPTEARVAFERNEVDAWAIWDFHLAMAEVTLNAKTLTDGIGLVNNYEIFSSRRSFSEQHPAVVEILLEEVAEASRWARDNPSLAAAEVAPVVGTAPEILEHAFARKNAGLMLAGPELDDNQREIQRMLPLR